MKLDVTLTSATNYSLVMTPLGGTNAPYAQTGSLKAGGPINWIEYNIYNTMSFGTNDYTNNFEISSMTISGLTIQGSGSNVILSWPTNIPTFTLTSATNLGSGATWNPVPTPPVVINGENVVTNPISTTSQFYRLKQ